MAIFGNFKDKARVIGITEIIGKRALLKRNSNYYRFLTKKQQKILKIHTEKLDL